MITDNDSLNELAELIANKVKKIILSELNNSSVEFSKTGVVVSIDDDGTYTVDTAFSTVSGLPNLSGEDLMDDDKVKIFYDGSDMRGAYIGVKF